MKLIVTFDDITFFDAWPAYKINEMIFCSKFILGCLCLRMIAAHTPTTAFVFGLATLVFVQACRNESRVGAFLDSSEWSWSQDSPLVSFSLDWLWREDLVLSEHIVRISFRIFEPRMAMMYFSVPESLQHYSLATAIFRLCATAFPRCFLLGVRTIVFGFLYPKCTYNIIEKPHNVAMAWSHVRN